MEHPPSSSSSEYSDENTPGAAAPSKSQKYLKSVESDFCSEFSLSLSLSQDRWLSEINVSQPHACLNFTRKFCCKHDACRKIVIGVGLFYVNWFLVFIAVKFFYKASFSTEMLEVHRFLVLGQEAFPQYYFRQKRVQPHLQFPARNLCLNSLKQLSFIKCFKLWRHKL